MHYFLITFLIFATVGCVAKSNVSGELGFSQERRIVILGEHVAPDIGQYYQKKYDALVWFTPSQGTFSDTTTKFIKGVGPSHGMQALIAELKSINYTFGRWEIFIPKIAEGYFLATLKNMPSGSLSKARGTVVMIDSKGNPAIEHQLKRVTEGSFYIAYDFQREIVQ